MSTRVLKCIPVSYVQSEEAAAAATTTSTAATTTSTATSTTSTATSTAATITGAATAAATAATTCLLAQDYSRLLTIVILTLTASPAILKGWRRKERNCEERRDGTSYAVSATRWRLLAQRDVEMRMKKRRPARIFAEWSLHDTRRSVPFSFAVV